MRSEGKEHRGEEKGEGREGGRLGRVGVGGREVKREKEKRKHQS